LLLEPATAADQRPAHRQNPACRIGHPTAFGN
jgi:hypothetical protein